MKCFVLIISFIIGINCQSQTLASLRLGSHYSTASSDFVIGPGLSMLFGVNENLAFGCNIDYQFIGSQNKYGLIESKFDYYPQEIYKGFHLGFNIGILTIEKYLTPNNISAKYGLSAGFAVPIWDETVLDFNLGLHNASPLGGELNKSQVLISPLVSIGTRF